MIVIATILYLVVGSLALVLIHWQSARSATAEIQAIGRIAAFVANRSGDIERLGKGIARFHFVQCLVYVADRVDERAYEPLRVIVKYYNLESLLLHRAMRSGRACERAYLLALLSRLPVSGAGATIVEQFLDDSSPRVRFYALMSLFSYSPYCAIAQLESVDYRLSRRDVSEILTLISRGSCPIPYMPLLMSENYNLQLLGIHLVRRFGITESRAKIASIVRDCHSELREEALETLACFGEAERYTNCTII